MLKIVGLVGSNADRSYNRLLLQAIKRRFKAKFRFEILEIKDVPMFNQSDDQSDSAVIQHLNERIENADGVIIATPEHNHTLPPALKSTLEWLSYKLHPFENKPVMVMGTSYYNQGTSRAQLHLRQVLEAPGVGAHVFPGQEFLLGKVKEAFNEKDHLIDQRTIDYLELCLDKFVRFVKVNKAFEQKGPLPSEDLWATESIESTIEGVDKSDPEWVEKAAELVGAAEGSDYVKLDRGILTVDQLNMFLRSMPMELTYADDNNQFLYYNRVRMGDDMLASRYEHQVGFSLAECHPESALKGAEYVIQQLRSGQTDVLRIPITHHGPDKYVVHNYQAMYYENGDYAGINEYILDFKPIVDFYLQKTGQSLVGGGDTSSGASDAGTDADSGASESGGGQVPATAEGAQPATDADSGASDTTSNTWDAAASDIDTQAAVDTSSGASEG